MNLEAEDIKKIIVGYEEWLNSKESKRSAIVTTFNVIIFFCTCVVTTSYAYSAIKDLTDNVPTLKTSVAKLETSLDKMDKDLNRTMGQVDVLLKGNTPNNPSNVQTTSEIK
ncbi:hypothetical protein K3G63_04815 [Hymenobacter sp. HSC-4F20]|uniref:hypothetical protein n=1 Tax=Hymenobacter sp. HSC-4F20 TaxID=2864135 RepID=UPI001C730F8C|nr:hypothetical protein [Hymenobacter sp. HSC-4F20]MBX0289746.1 hypothetical protein [Hymenobacter sp. HSC-4F20]